MQYRHRGSNLYIWRNLNDSHAVISILLISFVVVVVVGGSDSLCINAVRLFVS